VKVAQYEVLGNDAKRQVRPGSGRDDRIAWRLVWHAAQRLPTSLDRPVPPSSRRRSKGERGGLAGTDSSLKTLTQHSVLGYFREVSAGPIFSNRQHRS
jgi:hypothetical protein